MYTSVQRVYSISRLHCTIVNVPLVYYLILIGNLDPEIDEKYLFDTFSAFGIILQTPKILREPETGMSKGIAFVNFASFDASDAAMEALNGQFLSNRAIRISYSFKKDGKGERHGAAAERLLASKQPVFQDDKPHKYFSDIPHFHNYLTFNHGIQRTQSGQTLIFPQNVVPMVHSSLHFQSTNLTTESPSLWITPYK